MYRYSQEDLAQAVLESTSVTQVMRSLGMKVAGGSHSHLTRRIAKEGLDTSHFLGQASNRGKTSKAKKSSELILIKRSSGERARTKQLKRAMFESGFVYSCAKCAISSWQGQDITLDIDHIDGDHLNDTKENLRFMCPNCHSQTPTHRNKKRAAVSELAAGA